MTKQLDRSFRGKKRLSRKQLMLSLTVTHIGVSNSNPRKGKSMRASDTLL
ncbi:hypothetical protein BVRB_5g120100 [Beta vulgaris subsp. vulgaris]|nr:hypothetical protein BVRB_5g120100 [Beta vulgaris subsp. vulgaris]